MTQVTQQYAGGRVKHGNRDVVGSTQVFAGGPVGVRFEISRGLRGAGD